MEPVLSRSQMRDFDRYAIEKLHVSGLILMENAGRRAADLVITFFPHAGARTLIVCGKGNNGGDGFVVARHLFARGYAVQILLMHPSADLTGDARSNYDSFAALGGTIWEPSSFKEPLASLLAQADVVVDALLGTGLNQPVSGAYAHTIAQINAAPCLRVALDLPSGLDADRGVVWGHAIAAHHTITFGAWKTGLLTPQGKLHTGTVDVADLGVPTEAIVAAVGATARLVNGAAVRSWLQPRHPTVYKHRAGNVGIVGGSAGKIGAVLLAGQACLRAGAGLCTIITWPDVAAAVEHQVREIMVERLDRHELTHSLDAVLASKHVVAVGPGFGLDDTAKAAVAHVLRAGNGTKIFDADSISPFAGRAGELADCAGSLIVTPHTGELARLLGCSAAEIDADRFGCARRAAQSTGAVVVLKGTHTLIAHGEEVWVNNTGNPCLATAGAGDVLTGIIAALACTLPPVQAAIAGVFFHGAAADAWRADQGGADRGMLASELMRYLPRLLAPT